MKIKYQITTSMKARDYLLSFHMSKGKVYTLFLEKRITRNNETINENTILNENDIIYIDYNEEVDFTPTKSPLDIVYKDDYLLIINKPANIIIHEDDKTKPNTLCNIVANYFIENNINLSVKYAHRLDFETTGLIIFCFDQLTHAYMNHIISTHELKREYLALVENTPVKKEGVINQPIGEDRHQSNRKRISKTGKLAITNYKLIKSFKDYSLVSLLLETGRTHQIRVHMSSISCPLLGDTLYGGNKKYINRVALHSYHVSFIHPITKELVEIYQNPPKDMVRLYENK